MSNSAISLFNELEYKSSQMRVSLPYSGSPKYNLHNLNFIIENYCYSILKTLYEKEVYKSSAVKAKGFFRDKESSFNAIYGHLIQNGINYRIATTIDLDKKIVQVPENEEQYFGSENRLLFFKNNFFVIIDSNKCARYVDYYYNDVGNLTIDLASMIEKGDYVIFGLIDGSKITTSEGDYNKVFDSPSESFLKTSLKGCTSFTKPKYYAISKNRSVFEGKSFASIETLRKELQLDNSPSWLCRISKKNADVYDTLNNRSFLSQDIKSFKEIKNYYIIKSEDDSFLRQAYEHFLEIQMDMDALEKLEYLKNDKECKVSDALHLFDCKSKEEKAFYKAQLVSLKNTLGNQFTINNIKEKSQLGDIKHFDYIEGVKYNYYSWIKNGSDN